MAGEPIRRRLCQAPNVDVSFNRVKIWTEGGLPGPILVRWGPREHAFDPWVEIEPDGYVNFASSTIDFHGQDTHRERLIHELFHLHFRQHLGWFRNQKGMPTWFAEGLADMVANIGGKILTRQMALAAFAERRYFVPDARGRFPSARGLRDCGVPAPLLHQQSRTFVEFLHAKDSQAYQGFLYALLQGAEFADAFDRYFGTGLEQSWPHFFRSVA